MQEEMPQAPGPPITTKTEGVPVAGDDRGFSLSFPREGAGAEVAVATLNEPLALPAQ